MKAKITVNGNGSVTLAHDDFYSGERLDCTYFVAAGGERAGYVLYRTPDGQDLQVCEKLATTGITLTSTRAGLPALIRRVYRRAYRAHRKETKAGRRWGL